MKHKRFFRIILGFLALFLAYNAAVWALYTETLLTGPVGDLSRIGYISDVAQVKADLFDLPRRQISLEDLNGERLDLLTIGDSFSNRGVPGRNSRYQDYIASINGFNVANINASDENSMAEVFSLLRNGFFDRYRPKYLLLESVERECIKKFSGALEDYTAQEKPEKRAANRPVDVFKPNAAADTRSKPRVLFLNTGNFKYLLNAVLYNFSEHAFAKKVAVKELSRPLFSAGGGTKLLFYYDDIERRTLVTERSVESLNDNINYLSRELGKRNITLVFMPVVDKSNLYADYMNDDPYPKSRFFEKLRPLPKDYLFIDTKDILSKALQQGEKDIFHVDDTHWTWRASKLVFEAFTFR